MEVLLFCPEDFSVERAADDLPKWHILWKKVYDNVFGAGDYILFHAQGTINGRITIQLKVLSTNKIIIQTMGIFVTSDAGTGTKIVQRAAETTTLG